MAWRVARGVLALLSIVPALSAFILTLSVLAEGGPPTVSTSFFAFAVWAETQGATFAASPLTLSVLAKGAAIAFWALRLPPSVLADLAPSTIGAVWLSLAVRARAANQAAALKFFVRTTRPHHHGRGGRVNGLHGSCRVLDQGG